MNRLDETISRSLVKTLSWRLIVVLTDFSIVFLLTGKTVLAVSFAGIKLIVAAVLYFAHERVWNNVGWGKEVKNQNLKIKNQN